MEFKTSDGRYEIEPNRDGSSFVHDGIIVHAGGEIWLEIDGRKHKATATKVGDVWWVHVLGHTLQYEIIEAGATGSNEDNGLTAPMPGKILDVLVSQGQSVSQGDALMVMEAMKMEHRIQAPRAGEVTEVYFQTGERVDMGANLVEISD